MGIITESQTAKVTKTNAEINIVSLPYCGPEGSPANPAANMT